MNTYQDRRNSDVTIVAKDQAVRSSRGDIKGKPCQDPQRIRVMYIAKQESSFTNRQLNAHRSSLVESYNVHPGALDQVSVTLHEIRPFECYFQGVSGYSACHG